MTYRPTYLLLIQKGGKWIATSRDGKVVTTTDKEFWAKNGPNRDMPLIVVDPAFTAQTVDVLDGIYDEKL